MFSTNEFLSNLLLLENFCEKSIEESEELQEIFSSYDSVFVSVLYTKAKNFYSVEELKILPYTDNNLDENFHYRQLKDFVNFNESSEKDVVAGSKALYKFWRTAGVPTTLFLSGQIVSIMDPLERENCRMVAFLEDLEKVKPYLNVSLNDFAAVYNESLIKFLQFLIIRATLLEIFSKCENFSYFQLILIDQILTLDFYLFQILDQLVLFRKNFKQVLALL